MILLSEMVMTTPDSIWSDSFGINILLFLIYFWLLTPFIWLAKVIFIIVYPPIERLIVAIYSFFKEK
jgi:uncharacterized membrane protein